MIVVHFFLYFSMKLDGVVLHAVVSFIYFLMFVKIAFWHGSPVSFPIWIRATGSWPFQPWLTCVSACVCVCPSICPLPVLCPRLLHSATCAPVYLCCYCVCWLQFTEIWPYCRQVSFLWKVLQWDPGEQCDPGGWPSPATDVSWTVLGGQSWNNDYLARLSGYFLPDLYFVKNFNHRNHYELGRLSFFRSMISKEQFEKKKNDTLDPEPWVLSRQ